MDALASTVLVVDDEPRMVSMLQLALQAAGHTILTASDEDEAWRLLTTESVDLVILDVMLGQSSGTQLCRRIRQFSDMPVILLTALGETSDRVAGLEAGADDYVTKPFSPRELVLRVGALLRRTADRASQPVVHTRRAVGPLVLDAALSLARLDERDLHLTPIEFRIVWLLSERADETVPIAALVDALGREHEGWGAKAALRTSIYRLRGKLGKGDAAVQIRTEHGVGYRLVTVT